MTIDSGLRDIMLGATPNLRAFAISLTSNVDRADDLVQETLMRAIANIHRFQPGTNMQAWLFTILRNLFHSEYRKRRREVEDADGKYAATLAESAGQGAPSRFPGFARRPRPPAARPARGAASRWRVGLFLRAGGGDLRLRGRHHQEPRQPSPQRVLRT